MLSDDYEVAGTEPVLSVPQSGNCWVVDGRHGRTLVSRTLPIWDIDSIDPKADDESLLDRFQEQLERIAPGYSFRIYRTYAGVRVICTEPGHRSDRPEHLSGFMKLGRQIGADPIYMELCRKQQTCRARLDPKWDRFVKYVSAPANARACRLIGEDIGNGTTDPALMAQVEFHDRATMALFEHDQGAVLMRLRSTAIGLLAVMLLGASAPAAALETVTIRDCYDGDTCRTTAGERIRLACIDTPEMRGKTGRPDPGHSSPRSPSRNGGRKDRPPSPHHKGQIRKNRRRAVRRRHERPAGHGGQRPR